MIKEVENQVGMRNKFSSPNGVNKTMSPLTIMTGLPNPSYSKFKLEFEQYVRVYDYPTRTNDMSARTTPGIALQSSSSENGCFFMLLETGKRILRYECTEVPTPSSMIMKMHDLADKFKLKNKKINQKVNINMNNELDEDYDGNQRIQNISTYNDEANNYNGIQDQDPIELIDELSSKLAVDSIIDLTTS